jgi:GGDEF domain-containing protein
MAALAIACALLCAMAFAMVQVVRRSRAERDRAERAAAEQSALRDLALAVAAGTPPEHVQAIGADATTVLELAAPDRAVVRATCGDARCPAPGAELRVRQSSSVSRAILKREAVRRDGLTTATAGHVASLGFSGHVIAPIFVHGEPWGAIDAAVAGDRTLPPQTGALVEAAAELLSLSLANDRARQALSHQAVTDALSGLANRRALHDRLSQEVARAVRHARPLTIALLDLDGFREINDTLGNRHGDALLRAVGESLTATARTGDLVARTGGDEFAWLMPETEPLEAIQALDRARAAPSDLFRGHLLGRARTGS